MLDFVDLGLDDGAAVRGVGVAAEVVLVISFGWIEFLEGFDFRDDGFGEIFLGFL